MKLTVLTEPFSICKLENFEQVDINGPFVFTGSTDEERSLVCPTPLVPANTLERSDGWRAFRIDGVLDLSLVGILARISDILARNNIGIFAVSTFNTDYILTKENDFERAIQLLSSSGPTSREVLLSEHQDVGNSHIVKPVLSTAGSNTSSMKSTRSKTVGLK